MKIKLLSLFFGFICVYSIFNRDVVNQNPFRWDTFGYYSYLPAIFIYHDLAGLSFYPEVSKKYHPAGDEEWYAAHEQSGGKRSIKYPAGTAIFESPFFLCARAWCLITHYPEDDGYSTPYRYALYFSGIFWGMMSILVLGSFLRLFYNINTTLIALICIMLGTNVFHYIDFDAGMSHPYSFFLFSCTLLLTHKWYATSRGKYLYMLAIVLGLITITRPVNILICIIVLGWQINSFSLLRQRIAFFVQQRAALCIAALLFISVIGIQLTYWKYTSGHWVYYSYTTEKFNFLKPHAIKGLFSYRKGWFVYTPIAFVGMLGLIFLWFKDKRMVPSIIIFFSIFIYVVFSWEYWSYGGSFGCRPMIEALPIVSLPLAAFIERVFSLKSIIVRSAFSIILTALIALNLFQTYQFSHNVLHWDRMTKAYYWRTFLKLGATEDDQKLLMTDQEFWDDWNK